MEREKSGTAKVCRNVVRRYRDTMVRHRRSMLRLNTTVGQQILP